MKLIISAAEIPGLFKPLEADVEYVPKKGGTEQHFLIRKQGAVLKAFLSGANAHGITLRVPLSEIKAPLVGSWASGKIWTMIEDTVKPVEEVTTKRDGNDGFISASWAKKLPWAKLTGISVTDTGIEVTVEIK